MFFFGQTLRRHRMGKVVDDPQIKGDCTESDIVNRPCAVVDDPQIKGDCTDNGHASTQRRVVDDPQIKGDCTFELVSDRKRSLYISAVYSVIPGLVPGIQQAGQPGASPAGHGAERPCRMDSGDKPRNDRVSINL